MLLEFLLFLLELGVGITYPLLVTMKLTVTSDKSHGEAYRSWVFYWVSFIILQYVSWTLDFFLWNVLKVLILVALALPQLQLSGKASDFLLGPLQSILLEQFSRIKEQAKLKLG